MKSSGVHVDYVGDGKVLLFSSFSQYFTVPLFLLDSSHSSGIQWSSVEWNWIPVNSTGLQTEIEMELESGSKHMCTNSCKHKYGIYTDFVVCQ